MLYLSVIFTIILKILALTNQFAIEISTFKIGIDFSERLFVSKHLEVVTINFTSV